MKPDNYPRVKQLFLAACSLDDRDRADLLARECGGDAELRAAVEKLLVHHSTRTIIDSRAARATHSPDDAPMPVTSARRTMRVLWHEFRRHTGGYLTGLFAILLLCAGGLWAHYGVEESLRTVLRDELETVLEADVTALTLWLSEQKAEAARFARQSDLRAAAESLVRIAHDNKEPRDKLLASPALAEFREAMLAYVEESEGRTAYALINREGIVLAARRDMDVGVRLNSEGKADNRHAFNGETTVAKPHPLGSFALDRPLIVETPVIWVGTPVRDDTDSIVASLNLGINADVQFTRILSVARIGNSGETYAFDEKGWFLSDSRFTEQLRKAHLIPDAPRARAIFSMQVRDPGVNLTTGAKAELPHAAQPLTRMAAQAVAGINGVDVRGYRDYRGVKVIGAWRWLPEYGFGVVTEVDYAEAYAPLRYPIIASWLPLGVLLAAAAAVGYSAMRIARLQRQIGVARKLGQYTLVEKIGEGGMGVVYLAQHALLRRPTAVKLLKPELMSKTAVARFEREVQLASQLSHPNTIEIYDFGQTADGVYYYAMEYLSGISLGRLIEIAGAIPPARAVYILKQICGSLGEAHAIGLVHRDIKPHNIMLCERGGQADFIKVLDFGLVKNIGRDAAEPLTVSTGVTGTPLYMSPERLKDPLVADPRSDLYSLGAVGYNLLTGRSIFDCANDIDVFYHVMKVVPRGAAEINPAVPAALDRLIAACLAKNPADRPASAEEVLRVLDSLSGLPAWTETDARAWWDKHALAAGVNGAAADKGAAPTAHM